MRTILFLLTSSLATAACVEPSPIGSPDTGKSDGENDCKTDAQLIAAARQQLELANPGQYSAESWSEGRTQQIEDLDGDGLFDLLVFPGLQYSSTNEEVTVMHAGANDCIFPEVVGHFVAASVETELQGPEGGDARNLRTFAFEEEGCRTFTTWWSFDGTHYIKADEQIDSSGCDF